MTRPGKALERRRCRTGSSPLNDAAGTIRALVAAGYP